MTDLILDLTKHHCCLKTILCLRTIKPYTTHEYDHIRVYYYPELPRCFTRVISDTCNTDMSRFTDITFVETTLDLNMTVIRCKRITADYCKMTIDFIKQLIRCNTVILYDTNIPFDSYKYLAMCKCINLSESDVTDYGLRCIGNCKKLAISCCKYVTNAGVVGLKCNKLYMDYICITGSVLPSLSCTYISLIRCMITDDDCKYLSMCKDVELSYNKNLTDKGLRYLRNCHCIRLLGCNITDTGISELSNCKEIEINFCPLLTNMCLTYLTKCKHVSHSIAPTDDDIHALLTKHLDGLHQKNDN